MPSLDPSVKMPHLTESALERALTGRRQAFLGFLVKRLGNLADAEDVLQDFCIKVLAREGQLRDGSRMDAWLYAVLRSVLNDFFRKSGRSERLGAAFAMEEMTTQARREATEALAGLCACVETLVHDLKPADAELVRRVDLNNEPRKQVAAELGLAVGTLTVRLHRARVALRDKLLGHCGYCCAHGFEDCACGAHACHDQEA